MTAEHAAVSDWLLEHLPTLRGPLTLSLIAAGRSNLTYRVEDADGHSVIVRRPPQRDAAQPSAHDIAREHRILAGLARSGLPVPAPLALCLDSSVLGAEFLVMADMEGQVVRTRTDAATLTAPTRAAAGGALVQALLHIHGADLVAVGLADLSTHDGYLARQLRRWKGQLDRAGDQTAGGAAGPLGATHAILSRTVPPQQTVAVVHGDYRLDNVLLDAEGEVVAVLDWELCTLGDPLADLGILLASWAEPTDPVLSVDELEPTREPGFPSRAELVATYAAGSPLDLSDIGYYEAFGLWKLACVLNGVRVRYAAGATAGDLAGADQLAQIVGRFAAAAHAKARLL